MKRLMYHVLKKKYEEFIYSPKSKENRILKGKANYSHKIKIVKNKFDFKRQSVQDSLAVKSIVSRTERNHSEHKNFKPVIANSPELKR